MQGVLVVIPQALKYAFALAPVVGGAGVLVWRWHETRTPVTARKIVIPPLAMATGFCMFFAPQMRLPWTWGVTAVVLGALVLAIPLIKSSSLERSGEVVMMRRSQGFMLILLGLLALRIALHEWVGRFMSPTQTAALFYLLAFGMIVRWRVGMYLAYRALTRHLEERQPAERAASS